MSVAVGGPTDEELVILDGMKRNLGVYAQMLNDDYELDRFHSALAAIMQYAMTSRNKRIVITAPCRHGKSMMVSETAPAWFMGLNPGMKTMIVSHDLGLAKKAAARVRDKMESVLHVSAFGPESAIDPRRGAIDNFFTEKGGEVMIASVLGRSPIGSGADLYILDDPFNDVTSKTKHTRDQVEAWISANVFTRLEGKGPRIVVIMHQRWSEDDLVGRLKAKAKNDPDTNYEFFNFPALIEDEEDAALDFLKRDIGECLSPHLFDSETLLSLKAEMRPQEWSAMYQQRPRVAGGNRFKRDMLHPVEVTPEQAKNMTVYVIGDPAVGKNEKNDNTAISVVGLGSDKNLYWLDLIREKLSLQERWAKLKEIHSRWKPNFTFWEQYGGTSDIEYFKEKMSQDLYHLRHLENSAYLNHAAESQMKKGEAKGIRIARLIPDMNEGRWFANWHIERERMNMSGTAVERYYPFEEMLNEEMLTWTGINDDSDDGLDSVSRIYDLPLVWPEAGRGGFLAPVFKRKKFW